MQLLKIVASSFVLLSLGTFINDVSAGIKRVNAKSIAKIISAFFIILPPLNGLIT